MTPIITRGTLRRNAIVCPVCGKYYSSNGVGPQNNKKLTWGLQKLLFLSTKKFRLPAVAHDMTYLIAPYEPVLYKEGSYEKLCKTRKDCDDLFYDLMLAEANNSYPWMKSYYKKAAEVYYNFVRNGGQSSFKHEH